MVKALEDQTMVETNTLSKRTNQEKYLYRLLVFQSLSKASGPTARREKAPVTTCPLRSALTERSAVARGTFALEP